MRRKLVAALLLSSVMMAGTARADEAELLARIEALEQRVAQLEQMMGIGEAPAVETEAVQEAGTETVSLATGTWIVGEDLPAGKYNIICASGAGSVYFYNSYDDRKNEEYSFTESYYMGSEQQMKRFSKTVEEEEQYKSMFTMEVNNVRLENGNCIYSEAPEIILTPAQ